MRIREKFTGLLGIVFLNVVLIVALSLAAMAELARYQATAQRGAEVIARSRTVFDLMKDLAVTAFSPDTYARLKDVFYFEKFDSTLGQWSEAIDGFKATYGAFMGDPTIVQLAAGDSLVGDEYATANKMSSMAFGRIDSLLTGFRRLESTGLLSQENSYQRIVSSADPRVSGLFSEVRVTSYYLKNNFESFMNHFVKATDERIEATRSSMLWYFFGVTFVTVALSLGFSVVFGNRIIRHVGVLRTGMARLSRGDFSRTITVASRDELGELAAAINRLSEDLKHNVDRLLHVTREIGSGIDADTDLAEIRRIILATAGRETQASGAALLPRPGAVLGDGPAATSGLLDDSQALAELRRLVGETSGEGQFLVAAPDRPLGPFSSLIVCPLPVPTATHGWLALVTQAPAEPFTDLDFIVVQSYGDFAALSIDNYLKYRELIELREAEYQSLQAKIQPHFLYNVLNGLIGLNRMGDRGGLEGAVLDLKDLLRYTLAQGRIVRLDEELAFVGKYLDLQKLRFGERFDYRITCGPGCESLAIPKLLLQPLAENALIHGVEPSPAPGRVELTAERIGSEVRITVRDNGAGFDPALHDPSARVGLLNVTRRLELSYPGSKFRIESAPGKGCLVEIAIDPEGSRL